MICVQLFVKLKKTSEFFDLPITLVIDWKFESYEF